VDPVPDPLLFFSGSAGNRTGASGSVAKNFDNETTEAVKVQLHRTIILHTDIVLSLPCVF
jgi:hypothetical protein